MQRSLSQMTAAIAMATCLLLQSVHCAPAFGPSDVRQRHAPSSLSSSSLENYLLLRALLSPEKRLPTFLYDDLFNDMERSRRSGPLLETFEPVTMSVLRRLMRTQQQIREDETRQNQIHQNQDYFKSIGRRR